MSILSQLLSEFITSSNLFSSIDEHAASFTYPMSMFMPYFNTAELIEIIGEFSHFIAQFTLKCILEKADTEFRNSPYRTERWYVKATRSRTITTPFGDVTYCRTIYQPKDKNGKCFCYVDQKFGIPKYDRYDPCVKAMAAEFYANHNSMLKVGRIIGYYIHSPFSMKKDRKIHDIPRQTIFRFLKSRRCIQERAEERKNTPETLYIMADEKWIPLQDHDAQGNKLKCMAKAAVVFEDVATDSSQNNRHKLVNRYVFLKNGGNFWGSLYSRLCEMYDMEKVKRIWIMGDGAGWIKSGRRELSSDSTKSSFALDKFHFGQALHRISNDSDTQEMLRAWILEEKSREGFKDAVDVLIKAMPERRETIIENRDYILNNWNFIQNSYSACLMPCSMESAISHHICSMFTSVPKAYKENNLGGYLEIRMNTLNNVDNISQYIRSVGCEPDENGIVSLAETLDLSMFDGTPETYTLGLGENFEEITKF